VPDTDPSPALYEWYGDGLSHDLMLYKISDAVRLLRLSRAFVYRQIKAGRIRTVKEGSATRITAAALADYVSLLEAEASRQHSPDGQL